MKFKKGTSEAKKDQVVKEKGDKVKDVIAGLDVRVLDVGRGNSKAKANDYGNDPNVEYAELNGIYHVATYPSGTNTDDPQSSDQWGLNNTGQNSGTATDDIRAFNAWDSVSDQDNQVPVAVLDTGIKRSHPDLQNRVSTDPNLSKDFTNSASKTDDKQGHGTHVSGIIAAETSNGVGVAGTCGAAKCVLVNGKVLDDTGNGTDATVANGILWASGCEASDSTGKCTGNGGSGTPRAKVINMSLGGGGTTTLKDAVDKAFGNGVLLVAAAGNSGEQSPSAPAQYQNVVAVAATDNNDNIASYSNYGSGTLANGTRWDVDVAAPGTNILSTTNDGAYGYKSGTSMATPHVSGIAALVWSKTASGATSQDIRDKIEGTANQIVGTGSYWTKGRVDACKALDSTGTTNCGGPPPPTSDTTPPIVAYNSPGTNATGVSRTAPNITATFSEDMQESTVSTTTFRLVDTSTGARVDATVSCDSPCKTAKLTPSQSLASKRQYKVVVTTGALDLANNAMTQNRVWYFTTGRT